MSRSDDMSVYFSGEKLYGDDFSPEELNEWYEAETEGYAHIDTSDRGEYVYKYHAMNTELFFRYLPDRRFEHVLGFGSAYSEELVPIIERIGNITVVEPSDMFPATDLRGVPMRYVKPCEDGSMDFSDASFDLIICASALHHVANVSKVISEFARCVKPGGYVLIREPTVSMGDWRRPRKGLTAHERGIPLRLFDTIISSTGLHLVKKSRCDFPLTVRLGRFLKGPVYNSRMAVFIDGIFCRIFAWKNQYHATTTWQKLRPAAIAYVLQRSSE